MNADAKKKMYEDMKRFLLETDFFKDNVWNFHEGGNIR